MTLRASSSHIEDSVVKKINLIKSRKRKKENATSVSQTTSSEKSNKLSKRSRNKSSESDHEVPGTSASLLLKDVLDLGGTQEDFDLLNNVSEDEELEVGAAENSIDISELVTFMKSNGLKPPKKTKKVKVTACEPVKEISSEKVSKATTALMKCPSVPNTPPPHQELIFQTNEPWYTSVHCSKSSSVFEGNEKWRAYARQLWDNEIALSESRRDKFHTSNQQWISTVLAGGTINDKTSAHCLLLQESPVHHIRSLEALLAMARKKSKRLAIQAVDTLKEMFVSAILPDHRKLLSFNQHDFSLLADNPGLSFGWVVEDRLKTLYSEFMDLVKVHLSDNEVAIRTKLCNMAYQLVNEKPELEQVLLGMVVNKIGDPDNKLASKIIYLLGQLLNNHPSMKKVVSAEIERVLFRPNISERAQYYSICFLSQLKLTPEDGLFATHLIDIYFKFFKDLIERKSEDSRMLGALLTGVNRSYPYTSGQLSFTDAKLDTLFKLVYVANFNVSVQALMLLFQVSGNKEEICSRYYQALYGKLIDPTIRDSSKKTFLLNLIYKSLKRDTSVPRKVAIARRLFQICNLDDPVLACAALYTVSEANKVSTNVEKTDEKKTEGAAVAGEKVSLRTEEYDPAIRNPLYSNADRARLWELSLLTRNYHPSVNEFVVSLLEEGDIKYNGDPLNDFSRMRFFDKFVFKNPKTGVKVANKKFYTRSHKETSQPQVYSSEFRDQASDKIHSDEKFFYEYFKTKTTSSTRPEKEEEEAEDSDAESLDFADDIKLAAVSTKQDKKKKQVEESEDGGDDSDSEFSYSELPSGDEAEEEDTKLDDRAYEKFLWENLDSDGESLQGDSEEEEEVPGEEGGDEEEEDGGEEGWEDLSVGSDSEGESERKPTRDPGFVSAEQLDQLIKEKGKKKKKKTSEKIQKDSTPVVEKVQKKKKKKKAGK